MKRENTFSEFRQELKNNKLLNSTTVSEIAATALKDKHLNKNKNIAKNVQSTKRSQAQMHEGTLKATNTTSDRTIPEIVERSREEGEIFTEDSRTLPQSQVSTDNDCILIEDVVEKITIDDEDDNIFYEDVTGTPTLRCKPTIGILNTCDEVIVIDDSITPSPSIKPNDDSVQFVSETLPDFIPLTAGDIKQDGSGSKVPEKSISQDGISLFSRSEKKQIRDYNYNAFNPNKTEEIERRKLNPKRLVIIDGSNVAYAHSRQGEFSVEGLKICIRHLQQMGHEVKAVVPQFRLQRSKTTNSEELERMHKEGLVVLTPCKNLPGKSSTSYDDRFILQLAVEFDAAIVSNDNYRDLINENSAFKKLIENRVIGYTWCNDVFMLPRDPYGKFGPTLHSILNREIKH